MSLELTRENFQDEVLDYKGVTLVDFWAPWCGPCRMVGPVVEELSTEYAGKIKVAKLNTDEEMALAAQYSIMSIPTLMIFKDGKPVDKIVGAVPKPVIKQTLDRWVG